MKINDGFCYVFVGVNKLYQLGHISVLQLNLAKHLESKWIVGNEPYAYKASFLKVAPSFITVRELFFNI